MSGNRYMQRGGRDGGGSDVGMHGSGDTLGPALRVAVPFDVMGSWQHFPYFGICIEGHCPVQGDVAALSMPPILSAGCLDCLEDGSVSFLGGTAVSTEEVCFIPFESSMCSEEVVGIGISRLQYMGWGGEEWLTH